MVDLATYRARIGSFRSTRMESGTDADSNITSKNRLKHKLSQLIQHKRYLKRYIDNNMLPDPDRYENVRLGLDSECGWTETKADLYTKKPRRGVKTGELVLYLLDFMLLVLAASVISMLLIRAGVEMNPGPNTGMYQCSIRERNQDF